MSVSTDWTTYAGNPTVGPDGSFNVTEAVGEVPSTDGGFYGVAASGSSGSSASTFIQLNGDGCVFENDNAGEVTLQWGGNGFDPDTSLSLSIDGNAISTATTDSLGSGGSSADFTCPSSGSFTWEVSGTDNGQPSFASEDMSCVTATTAGNADNATRRAAAAARSSSAIAAGRHSSIRNLTR